MVRLPLVCSRESGRRFAASTRQSSRERGSTRLLQTARGSMTVAPLTGRERLELKVKLALHPACVSGMGRWDRRALLPNIGLSAIRCASRSDEVWFAVGRTGVSFFVTPPKTRLSAAKMLERRLIEKLASIPSKKGLKRAVSLRTSPLNSE